MDSVGGMVSVSGGGQVRCVSLAALRCYMPWNAEIKLEVLRASR